MLSTPRKHLAAATITGEFLEAFENGLIPKPKAASQFLWRYSLTA